MSRCEFQIVTKQGNARQCRNPRSNGTNYCRCHQTISVKPTQGIITQQEIDDATEAVLCLKGSYDNPADDLLELAREQSLVAEIKPPRIKTFYMDMDEVIWLPQKLNPEFANFPNKQPTIDPYLMKLGLEHNQKKLDSNLFDLANKKPTIDMELATMKINQDPPILIKQDEYKAYETNPASISSEISG